MTRIRINDHALVHWLERAGGLDLAALREQLSASLERSAAAAETIGAREYLILADGLVYVIRDGELCKVLKEDGRHGQVRALVGREGFRSG